MIMSGLGSGTTPRDPIGIQQAAGLFGGWWLGHSVGRSIVGQGSSMERIGSRRREFVNRELIVVDVTGGSNQGVEQGFATNVDDELMTLAIIVTAVTVIGIGTGFYVAIGFWIYNGRAQSTAGSVIQVQYLRLKVPRYDRYRWTTPRRPPRSCLSVDSRNIPVGWSLGRR
jgi:hypothetical protein